MSILTGLALIAGCLLLLVAIAGVVVVVRYRPTVEYAYVERGQRSEAVTGWKRAVALAVGAPLLAAGLLLRALGLLRDHR
jgi:hypothetical protein